MNVFILSTGRCGSFTFVKACKHIINYTAAHESNASSVGHERLDYPHNHVESDNRLSWFLGRLDRKYGNEAFYVHLKRDIEKTAKSYSKRFKPRLIMHAYTWGIYFRLPAKVNQYKLAYDYCKTVNANIELFLKDKTNKMYFRLENAKNDFEKFWHMIGAKGNMELALQEWDKKYNKHDPEKFEKKEKGLKEQIVFRIKSMLDLDVNNT